MLSWMKEALEANAAKDPPNEDAELECEDGPVDGSYVSNDQAAERVRREHEQSLERRRECGMESLEDLDPKAFGDSSTICSWNTSDLLTIARSYQSSLGWSVIPIDDDKRPIVKWAQFAGRKATEQELEYWFKTWPATKGLAVVMGDISGNLVCRDFDKMEAYQRWATSKPDLAKQLPTCKTHRGMHVYFLNSRQNRTIKFNDGELRASGITILPPSQHPSGDKYRWVCPPTKANLLVIDELAAAGFIPSGTEQTDKTEYSEKTKNTDHTERTDEVRSHELNEEDAQAMRDIESELEELIAATLPTEEGQRNHCLFQFARALRTRMGHRRIDRRLFKPMIKAWHTRALPVIRTKPFEETWFDFLNCWPKINVIVGGTPIEVVMARVKLAAPPHAAMQYEQSDLRMLVTLCCELQKESGTRPFYLSCRKAGELLGLPHATTARWLSLMVMDGVLEEVSKGNQSGRASRYRYRAT